MIILILFAFLVVLYIFMRFTQGICTSSSCLIGKTVLVTGANSGIGYQTVLNLASRGCRVIMADVQDLEQSKNNVIKCTNNNNIITKKLDLSSLESVRNFARDIINNESRLDVLINNAGIGVSKDNRTKDGLNPVMQVNYFGHFLLTHLLIDLLKKSAPSRIIFTSSCASFFSNLSIENLNYKPSLDSSSKKFFTYCNSKYALLIASDIFAKKLTGTGVTSNSVHPGLVKTVIYRQYYSGLLDYSFTTAMTLLFIAYVNIFGKNQWEGGQTLVHAAVSKELEGTTGKHFWDCKPFMKPSGADDATFGKKIWDASEKYVRLEQDEKL